MLRAFGATLLCLKNLNPLKSAHYSEEKTRAISDFSLLLNSAQKAIKNYRPFIFIEVENHWFNCFGFDSEKLLNLLLAMDYILLRLNTEYPTDHLCIPHEKQALIPEIIKNLNFSTDLIDGKSVKLHFEGSDKKIPYFV